MIENIILPISLLIILLAVILYIHQYKDNRNILFHSLFLIIYAIWAMATSLLNFGGPAWLMAILLNNVAPVYYLSPVFFYLFVRSVFTDTKYLRKTDLLHFLPFLFNMVAVVPYLFTSFDYKLDIVSRVVQNPEAMSRFDYGMLYPHIINLIARPVIFLVYMALSLRMVLKFLPRYKSSVGDVRVQYRFMIRTVTFEVVVLSLITLTQLFIRLDFFLGVPLNHISDQQQLLLYAASLFYVSIPIYILLNPRFLYGLPQSTKSEKASVAEKPPLNENVKCKPVNQVIKGEQEIFMKLSEKMMDYITTEKPYLNPGFSVHDICIHQNLPRHHVQYCLNMILNKSFAQLKNELRVAYAMELMKNNATANLSIEGIGRQSGFASNSNFYTSFREVTGLTPIKWMEEASSSPFLRIRS